MKLLAALFVAVFLAGSVIWPASGQTPPQGSCFPIQELAAELEKQYGEQPRARAPDSAGTMVVLFGTDNGSTWTLVRLFPDGTACLAVAGTDWRPMTPGKGT